MAGNIAIVTFDNLTSCYTNPQSIVLGERLKTYSYLLKTIQILLAHHDTCTTCYPHSVCALIHKMFTEY